MIEWEGESERLNILCAQMELSVYKRDFYFAPFVKKMEKF